MQHGHAIAKALLETPRRLRRERDLGHEHDRAPTFAHDPFDRLDIHVRLTATGDAEEQCLVKHAPVEHRIDTLQAPLLVRRSAGTVRRRAVRTSARACGSTSRSSTAPVLTARAITAFEKPASSASARGTPGCSRTKLTSACALLPRIAISPGYKTRTRYTVVLGSTKRRSRAQFAAAYQRLHVAQQRTAIAGAARVGMAQQRFEGESVAKFVPDQTHQARRHRRIALRIRLRHGPHEAIAPCAATRPRARSRRAPLRAS